jgi:hypothetical protein
LHPEVAATGRLGRGFPGFLSIPEQLLIFAQSLHFATARIQKVSQKLPFKRHFADVTILRHKFAFGTQNSAQNEHLHSDTHANGPLTNNLLLLFWWWGLSALQP